MKIINKNNNSKNKIKKMKKKRNRINISNFKIINRKKKYHSGKIEGEDLPQSQKGRINFPLLLLGNFLGTLVVLMMNYVINFLRMLLEAIGDSKTGLVGVGFDYGFNAQYLIPIGDTQQFFMIALVINIGITFLVYGKLNYESEKNIVYGQKGDSRFATIKEIKKEYHEIPEKTDQYDGVGGIPISHYEDKYYIDRDTVNTVVLGASRSGKGETFVVPTIDILSRAKEQSNMVVNDPKGELFSASKETLEKRGYRVLVLNIDDPLQSMSFNPLQLVIDSWANKDYHEASKRANTLTSMLFASGMGTDNEFFYKSAKSAVNAIILTIVEDCFKNNCIEKITMYNVAQMLNELGSLFYADPKTPGKEKNALDEYFNNLPQGNQAKIQYGSTSFAGDKAKGSILSTASQGIEMFTSDLFGKLTSKMSIDLKEIGFPKSVQFKLDPSMVGKRVNITFLRKGENNKISPLKQYRVKVKALGLCVLNFDDHLQDGDMLEVRYEEENEKSRAWYLIEFPKQEIDNHDTKLDTKKFKSGKGFSDLVINSLVLKYTDQPTAVFMVIPDYDPSNHVIGSIFISQLYTELATNCKDTPNKKCFRRVHFLLDEFGNMPAIDNMDGIMTVCLGRNILFDLIIQSYSQLENRYDKGAKIIKENCQNHILIMSNDDDTIEEISKKCGNKTILSKSSSAKHLETNSSVTSSADQERVITFERASQLIEGEQVILRNLHRQNTDRKKIRPFPIFNTKITNMPYRYQFLNEDFDTRKDINEIDITCEHIDLSLQKNIIPFARFIKDLRTRLEYSITNNIPISEEDYNEYMTLPNSQQTLNIDDLVALLQKKNPENKESENLNAEDKRLNIYINDCRKRASELIDLVYNRSSENSISGVVLNGLEEHIFDSKFNQLLLNGQVVSREHVEKSLGDIVTMIEKLHIAYAIPVNTNGILKNHITKYKNSLDKLLKVIEKGSGEKIA